MRCWRCEKELGDGDIAYVQTVRTIAAAGTRADFNDREIVVCEDCS